MSKKATAKEPRGGKNSARSDVVVKVRVDLDLETLARDLEAAAHAVRAVAKARKR